MNCKNCSATLTSEFCGECGQPVAKRLTLAAILVSLWQKFSDSETGLRPTLSGMIRAPGSVPARFIAGERRRFIHPVSWFIIAATLQLVSIWFNQDHMIALISGSLSPELTSSLSAQGIDNPAQWAGERYILLLQNAYTWMLAITFFLPTACALRLLLWRSGQNIAEPLVWSLYSLSLIVALTGVIALVTVRLSAVAHGLIAPFAYLIYAGFAGAGSYGRRLWPITACVLATFIGFVCFAASLAYGQSLMLKPTLFS